MRLSSCFLLFIFTLFLYSCQKTEQEVNNDTQSVIDNVNVDNVSENLLTTINDYGLAYLGMNNPKIDTNVIVTITPQYPIDSFPKTMIINYGNGISCNDGCTRKGKIIVVFDGKWDIDSTVQINAEIDLNSYCLDNVQVIGSMQLTCFGSSSTVPEYSFKTDNSRLVFPNGENTSWAMNRTVKWNSGFETIDDKTDDIFLISGSITGINRKGVGYESVIKEPLSFDNSCYNGTITKGIFELTPQGLSSRIVDFGNGTCDKNATVTINGISFNVSF